MFLTQRLCIQGCKESSGRSRSPGGAPREQGPGAHSHRGQKGVYAQRPAGKAAAQRVAPPRLACALAELQSYLRPSWVSCHCTCQGPQQLWH